LQLSGTDGRFAATPVAQNLNTKKNYECTDIRSVRSPLNDHRNRCISGKKSKKQHLNG
jgi:hypothetical protein